MANELILNATLAYNKNNVTVNEQVGNLKISVVGNNLFSNDNYTAPVLAAILPIGSVTVGGNWFFFQNNDPTNYIELTNYNSGSSFTKLFPGEFCLLRIDPLITAIGVKTNTAPAAAAYCIFDA